MPPIPRTEAHISSPGMYDFADHADAARQGMSDVVQAGWTEATGENLYLFNPLRGMFGNRWDVVDAVKKAVEANLLPEPDRVPLQMTAREGKIIGNRKDEIVKRYKQDLGM